MNRFLCAYTSPQSLAGTSRSGATWEELRLCLWAWVRRAARLDVTDSLGFCEGPCPQEQSHNFSSCRVITISCFGEDLGLLASILMIPTALKKTSFVIKLSFSVPFPPLLSLLLLHHSLPLSSLPLLSDFSATESALWTDAYSAIGLLALLVTL